MCYLKSDIHNPKSEICLKYEIRTFNSKYDYHVTPTWDWIELNWVGSWVGLSQYNISVVSATKVLAC